jgi:hypothetical protein
MRFRKLRIAVSGGCAFACVLLTVLWMRSYYVKDLLDVAVPPHWLVVESARARISFRLTNEPNMLGSRLFFHSYGQHSARFSTGIDDQYFVLHGAVVIALALLGILPWLHYRRWRCRFSLRTLLVATSLVAVVLEMIVVLCASARRTRSEKNARLSTVRATNRERRDAMHCGTRAFLSFILQQLHNSGWGSSN